MNSMIICNCRTCCSHRLSPIAPVMVTDLQTFQNKKEISEEDEPKKRMKWLPGTKCDKNFSPISESELYDLPIEK